MPPRKSHKVEIVNYTRTEDSVENTLANIRTGKNVEAKRVKQSELFQNAANWNFVKGDLAFQKLYRDYERNSLPMSNYYEHAVAQTKFRSKFYFDGGGSIDKKLLTSDSRNAFEVFDYKRNNYDTFKVSTASELYYPHTGKVTFPHGSQGIVTFRQKYKIIWRTRSYPKFQYTDRPLLLVNNQSLVITSNSQHEIIYLLALLNSPLTRLILERNLRQESEKDFLVPIKAVKQYVRVPVVTGQNRHIKKEVIDRTEEMLSLEERTLSDYVDFSGILVQKFEDVQVEGNNLVLVYDGQKLELPIKERTRLVASSIAEQLGAQRSALEKRYVSLHELRNLPIIDYEKQRKIKAYIDDLVFALYFGVPLPKLGLKNAAAVRKACLEHRHYEYTLKG